MQINLKYFAIAYVAIVVLLMAVSYALDAFFGISVPSGVSTVLPAMLGAMVAGQKFVSDNKQGMEGREMWRQSLKMTGVLAVLNVVFLIAAMFIPGIAEVISTVGFGLVAIAFVVLLAITYLIVRMGLGMGIRSGMQALTKSSE